MISADYFRTSAGILSNPRVLLDLNFLHSQITFEGNMIILLHEIGNLVVNVILVNDIMTNSYVNFHVVYSLRLACAGTSSSMQVHNVDYCLIANIHQTNCVVFILLPSNTAGPLGHCHFMKYVQIMLTQ